MQHFYFKQHTIQISIYSICFISTIPIDLHIVQKTFFASHYIYIFPRASTTNIDKGKLLWGKNCTNWAQWMNTKLSIKIEVSMNASCVVLAYLSNFNKRHYANEVTFFALEQIELRELKFRVFCVIFSYNELKYAMKCIFCLTAYLICRI